MILFRSLKAKYRSLVIRKIIRSVEKNRELASTSILEAMVMLRKSWDDVSEQTIVNCFRKAGISRELQESAVDESDDPFRSLSTDVDDSIGELEFDLDQLRQINHELAPDDLDAAGLIGFDTDVATNSSQPLTVEEIVNEVTEVCNDEPSAECDEDEEESQAVTCPSRNEVDEAVEILSTLTLFSEDTELASLVTKLERKIAQNQHQQLRQSTIHDFFS